MAWRTIRTAAVWLLAALLLFTAGCGPKEAGPPAEPVPASGTAPAASPASPDPRLPESSPTDAPVSKPGPSHEPAEASPESTEPPAASAPSPKKQTPEKQEPEKQPPEKQSPDKQAPAENAARTVTISVTGNVEWGTVLAPAKVPLKDNDTAADLLIRTLKENKLAYETKGSGAFFYVAGIDGLYEFDDGPTHGWKYRVNGKVPDAGAGSYELKAGDRVEWFYAPEDEAVGEAAEEQSP